jgi:hypothetical protein
VLSDIQKSSNPKITLPDVCLMIVFIVLVAVTVIIRIRTIDAPLERDEGEYAYAGQLMLEGVPPYSLVYNMKMPGIYVAYAVILACFGQTGSGIHIAVLLINTATILLLFFLAKKFFGPIAGVACAVFFALTVISKYIQATANAENFVILSAIAGIILLVNFTDSKRYLSLVTAGLLLGIAFMMKQHGAGFILFGLLFLLWEQIRQKPLNYKSLASVILLYSLSAILPFLITCLILWYCGVFEKFWFWTFKYAHQYVSMVPLEIGLRELKRALTEIIPTAPFIWLSALLGFLSIIWNKEVRKHSVFLVGFLICSFLAVCPGFYFRNHYFVLFLPVLTMLAAAGVIAIRDLLDLYIKSKTKTAFISILVILAVWLQSFYSQRNYLLESDPIKVSRTNFGINPFPEAQEIANFIKNRSNKDDKIAVVGSEPEIFFYSHKRSATAYVYVYPLMEPQPYAADMQREMISQIEANKPKYIVFVNCFFSWLVEPDSNKLIFDWFNRYMPSHYRQIGLVEIFSSDQTLYRWNSVAKPSKKEDWLFIGERID